MIHLHDDLPVDEAWMSIREPPARMQWSWQGWEWDLLDLVGIREVHFQPGRRLFILEEVVRSALKAPVFVENPISFSPALHPIPK